MALVPIAILLAFLSLVLNTVEPILFIKQNLSARIYFIFQLIKIVFWTTVIVVSITVLAKHVATRVDPSIRIGLLIESIVMLYDSRSLELPFILPLQRTR